MEKEMSDVKVYVSEKGFVCISQSGAGFDQPETVVMHPDQVDILIQWLRDAKAEAVKNAP